MIVKDVLARTTETTPALFRRPLIAVCVCVCAKLGRKFVYKKELIFFAPVSSRIEILSISQIKSVPHYKALTFESISIAA